MPDLNTVNNIKISDYFNLNSPQVIKLFKDLGLESQESIKKAIVTTILGDQLDQFIVFEKKRNEYRKELEAFNNFKNGFDKIKDPTDNQKALYNQKVQQLEGKKTEMDEAKLPIAKYVDKYNTFDFKKALDDHRPKDEFERKNQADMVARFLTMSLYDEKRNYKYEARMKLRLDQNGDLSKEEKRVIKTQANTLAEKFTAYENNVFDVDNDIDKLRDTYQKNNTFEDRLMFTLVHHAKKSVLDSMRYDLDDMDDDKYQLDEDEEYMLERDFDDLIDSMEINSLDDVKKYMKIMADMKARLINEAGNEINNLKNLLKDEDYSESKAVELYKSDYYKGPSKILLDQYKVVYSKFTVRIYDEINKLHKVTEESTFDDVLSITDLDPKYKAVHVSYTGFDESTTLKEGQLINDRGSNYMMNEISKTLFKKYEKEANDEISANLKNYPGYDIGFKGESDKEDNYLDDQWSGQFNEKFYEASFEKNMKMLYSKFSNYLTSGKSFEVTKKTDFYENLNDGVPKFEEAPINIDEVGHIPSKIEMISILLPERMEEWEKEKAEHPNDIKILSKNIAQELENDLKDHKPEKQKAPRPENYDWMNELFSGRVIDERLNLKDKQILQLNSRLDLNLTNSTKVASARLASSIIPNREQEEAYKLMGLNDVPNSARLAHYYLYVIAKKPGLDLTNLRSTCEDPALKREYLDFCAKNTYAHPNEFQAIHVWADIYKAAATKLKEYRLPDIDYGKSGDIFRNREELYALRTITKNASLLADKMFNKSARDLFETEQIDIMSSISFFEHADYMTRSLDDAWFMVPTVYRQKDAPELLMNTASNRMINAKRMETIKGKTLNEATGIIGKGEAYVNTLSDKTFIYDQANKAFYDVRTTDYLAGHPNADHVRKIDKIFSEHETVKQNAFSAIMQDNLGCFRRSIGENGYTRRNNQTIRKMLLKRNTVKDMLSILNDDAYDFRGRDVRQYIDSKFDILFSKDVRQTLKVNNIDELDTILIDGVTPNELWGPNYADVADPADRKRMIQMEILRTIYIGDKNVEIKNYTLDKNATLKRNGTLGVIPSRDDVKKIATLSAQYKEINKVFLPKLNAFKTRLIDVLPPVRGESQQLKEARVLVDGTDLYKDMAQSLKRVIDLLGDKKAGALEIRNAMEDLRKASETYYKERKGVLFGPREGKGTGRLSVSDDLKQTVSDMLMTYDNMLKSTETRYTFGASGSSVLTASVEDLDREIMHIRSTRGEQLGINAAYVEEVSNNAKPVASVIDERSKLQKEIVDLIRAEYKGEIKIDYTTKDVDQMIQEVPDGKPVDKAGYFVYKQLLGEAFRNDYSIEDMNYIVSELKTGHISKEIENISKNISDIEKPGYVPKVINDIRDNHDVEGFQKSVVEVEKANARRMFDQRAAYHKQYNNVIGYVGNEYSKSFFKPDEYNKLKNRIHSNSKYTLGRSAGVSLMIYALALEKEGNKDKYTLEQLLDTEQFVDVKKNKFKEIVDLMAAVANKETNPAAAADANKKLAEILYKGHKKMIQLSDDVAARIDFSDEYFDCSKEFVLLMSAGATQYDAWQEISHCKNELLELARADNPEIDNYEKLKVELYRWINPASAVHSSYSAIDDYVRAMEAKTARGDQTGFASSIITTQISKNFFRQWAAENKNEPISLYAWSRKNDATVKVLNSKKSSIGIASDVIFNLNRNALDPLKDQIIDGTLFSDVTYDHDKADLDNYGIHGMPRTSEVQAEVAYKPNTKKLLIDKDNKLKRYDEELKGASPERTTYIRNAKLAVKKLSEYLQYGFSINESRRKVVKECVRTIVAEKWSKVFEEKGYRGNDLRIAVRNATEYMMIHDNGVATLTNKTAIDKIAFTDHVGNLVSRSKNGLFMGESGVACNRLLHNNYNNSKDLCRDVAYARTAQILRINGRIPKDADTDTPISCTKYFDTLKNSTVFKNTLKDPENPNQYRSPRTLLNETLDDKTIKKDIIMQETAVIKARQEREDEAFRAQREAIDAAEREHNKQANAERVRNAKKDGNNKLPNA
ncbi:MAG: hypothetical protein K6F60_04730 [Eubacterium sp.]|nr:hypothetical protein [Eubacterium sp.]